MSLIVTLTTNIQTLTVQLTLIFGTNDVFKSLGNYRVLRLFYVS